jgi:hypothetical protein
MRLLFPLSLALLGALLPACDSDAERPGSADGSASGTTGSGGSGGAASSAGGGAAEAGGAGGAGASGGAATGGGGAGVVEYRAVNLVTGAPRFVLTKKDIGRDLCFQLRLLMGAGDFATFDAPGMPFEELLVAEGAATCGETGGAPPSAPPTTSVPAADADGDIGLSDPPCAVTASFTLAFDDPQPWVPASEVFEVRALPIEQGCP